MAQTIAPEERKEYLEGARGDLLSYAEFCNQPLYVECLADHLRFLFEEIDRVKQEALAQGWGEGCLAGFAAAAKGYYKKDDDERMDLRLTNILNSNPHKDAAA